LRQVSLSTGAPGEAVYIGRFSFAARMGTSAAPMQFDPRSLLALNVIIAVMMYGAALSLRPRDFARILRSPVAPAIGPTVSGIILSLLDWRWMFWLVLPIGLGALAIGRVWLQNVTEPRQAPLDLLSVPLSAIGFGGVVYGLSIIGEGHGDADTMPLWLPLAVGGAALAVFVRRQLRHPRGTDARIFHHCRNGLADCSVHSRGEHVGADQYRRTLNGTQP
jgi:hypothetical protein